MCEASCTISKRCTQTLTPEWGNPVGKYEKLPIVRQLVQITSNKSDALHFTSNKSMTRLLEGHKNSTKLIAKSVSSWQPTGIEWSQRRKLKRQIQKGGTRHLIPKLSSQWLPEWLLNPSSQLTNSYCTITNIRWITNPASPTGKPERLHQNPKCKNGIMPNFHIPAPSAFTILAWRKFTSASWIMGRSPTVRYWIGNLSIFSS